MSAKSSSRDASNQTGFLMRLGNSRASARARKVFSSLVAAGNSPPAIQPTEKPRRPEAASAISSGGRKARVRS